jgi:FRG domain
MTRVNAAEFGDTDSLLAYLRESAALGFIWYRGHESNDWGLLPGIHRANEKRNQTNLLKSFWQRAALLSGAPPTTDVSAWLSLAQHHGLPTRALDWTESFLVALYFALDKPHSTDASRACGDQLDGAVWLLNPTALNSKFAPGSNGAFSETEDIVHFAHKSAVFGAPYPSIPTPEFMAYLPRLTHGRMVVQKACFTWHHVDIPLDEYPSAETYLRRVKVRAGNKAQMRYDLTLLGIADSTLYPDFDGLASEMKKRAPK